MNLLSYEPVVQRMLSGMNVKRAQKEDFAQNCYVALLENSDILIGEYDEETAELICKTSINKSMTESEEDRFTGRFRGIGRSRQRIESMDDPKIWSRVAKIAAPETEGITESELQEAINQLSDEERHVILSLYVVGRTLEKTGDELGMTIKQVRVRQQHGIRNLKKYFEVEE